jgi:hypothetical protein
VSQPEVVRRGPVELGNETRTQERLPTRHDQQLDAVITPEGADEAGEELGIVLFAAKQGVGRAVRAAQRAPPRQCEKEHSSGYRARRQHLGLVQTQRRLAGELPIASP